jgi:hypothetical protein
MALQQKVARNGSGRTRQSHNTTERCLAMWPWGKRAWLCLLQCHTPGCLSWQAVLLITSRTIPEPGLCPVPAGGGGAAGV